MSDETYAETAVLVAIMEDDYDEADRLLAGFLPGELATFEDQIDELQVRLRQARRRAAYASAPQRPTPGTET